MNYISEIVAALDIALAETTLGDFYARRKLLTGGNRWTGALLQIQGEASEARSGYAFHKGGRSELQFNIGFEEEGAELRYGVAFSLEANRDLPDPVGTLSAKMDRFNRVIGQFPELWSLRMWHHDGGRGPTRPVGPIPDDWVRRGVFIFLGERASVPASGIGPLQIARAAQVLNMLWPLYEAIETKTSDTVSAADFRVARLCWNTDFWQRPTGVTGKSANPKTFECEHGFGHEEWLFDCGTLLDGWKYGFVQALNHSHEKYASQRLNLLFYTLDNNSKQRFWAGSIRELEVLTDVDARNATQEFAQREWLAAMRAQVEAFGLKPITLTSTGSLDMINVRYRPETLRTFDPPIPFPAADLRSYYYGTLQAVPQAQAAIVRGPLEVEALAEQNVVATSTTRRIYERTTDVDLVQAQWQQSLRKTLPIDLPGVDVKIETVVNGHHLDGLLIQGKRRVFIEMKARGTVRQVIREALAQLMEYAYWPNAQRCDVLLIVGALQSGEPDRAYLAGLRERFGLPVHYLRYHEGHIEGIADWCRSLD